MIIYLYRVPELEVEEENQVQEMTLDEWKNLQEQTRPKPEFNIRKPESTVPSKAVVIHKSKYRDDVSKPSVLGEYVPLPSSGTIRPLLKDMKTEPSVWGVWCGGQRRRVVLSTEAIRFGTHLAISSPSTWRSCFCSGLTKGDGKEWNLVCWQENTTFSAGLESKPGRHKGQGFHPPWPLRGTEQLFQRLLFWLDCCPLGFFCLRQSLEYIAWSGLRLSIHPCFSVLKARLRFAPPHSSFMMSMPLGQLWVEPRPGNLYVNRGFLLLRPVLQLLLKYSEAY